ncbi:MAG: tetratricopeptide repeat protein [Gemmataceae bacterium]
MPFRCMLEYLVMGGLVVVLVAETACSSAAQDPKKAVSPSDVDKVERLLAARKEYQTALEQLRTQYIATGDMERTKWAEEELIQYHRINKQAFRLELDVPPPTLQAGYNIKEANELYRQALTYKDKGWNTDYIDNQRRAELLLQQLLTQYPQSSRISDTAYQLGDIYESKAFKQYRRAGAYYERCFQWNKHTHLDARLRAARVYDKQLLERNRAIELYKEVTTHETDAKQIEEARKRLAELSAAK